MSVANTLMQFQRDGSWKRIVRAANALSPAMAAHYGEGRTGCVLTLYEQNSEIGTHVQTEIGTPDQLKLGRYYTLSLEKAVRTARLREDCSWNAQRSPEQQQYGGAFKIPFLPLYLSCSGWKEEHDVVFGVYVLRQTGHLRDRDAFLVLQLHRHVSVTLCEQFENFIDTFETVPI